MVKQKIAGKRLLVLDTNVLMHDPAALFKFHEHDIFIPMAVLEELDAAKKGLSEVARNVRQANRFLDDIAQDATHDAIRAGLPLRVSMDDDVARGKLFFQMSESHYSLPLSLPKGKSDNTILSVALSLKELHPEVHVSLVSKDMNLRLKAGIMGLHAEDYYNDRVFENLNELHAGYHLLSEDVWQTHSQDVASWQEKGRTFYRITGPLVLTWYPHDFICIQGDRPFSGRVRSIEKNTAVLERITEYSHDRHRIWGVAARNPEQNYALNLLMDPDVDFVTLQGSAGSGKTLLALAAGLLQTMEHNRYREIIMTRVTVPVGEDIGFLPGTEEEKMTPWMGALMDNLEVLHDGETISSDWERAATQDLLSRRIKVRSLNFMRGRTFLNRYVIVDEAQNLTAKQMKTLVTRAGPGTKFVCLGDLTQIDTPYLTEMSSGLAYVIDHFKACPYAGHVTLRQGERSRLAAFAAENL